MAINWKDNLTDQLCDAFLLMKNKDEMYALLEDIATIGEIKALSQRLEVAMLLSKGLTYPQIAQKTGASNATISRVKKCFEHGTSGYSTVIERLEIKEND